MTLIFDILKENLVSFNRYLLNTASPPSPFKGDKNIILGRGWVGYP